MTTGFSPFFVFPLILASSKQVSSSIQTVIVRRKARMFRWKKMPSFESVLTGPRRTYMVLAGDLVPAGTALVTPGIERETSRFSAIWRHRRSIGLTLRPYNSICEWADSGHLSVVRGAARKSIFLSCSGAFTFEANFRAVERHELKARLICLRFTLPRNQARIWTEWHNVQAPKTLPAELPMNPRHQRDLQNGLSKYYCGDSRAGLKGRGPGAIFTGGPRWRISWRHHL